MTHDPIDEVQRELYLASRTTGDVRALTRGRLGQRLVNRYKHRAIINLLRRLGVW